jgi:tetratricopeptide (TPR) repeat protein
MVHRLILSVVLLAGLAHAALAQASNADNAADAGRLYIDGLNLVMPVELQVRGYAPESFDAAAVADHLRKACLLLEAANKLDPSNGAVAKELFTLYISNVLSDPGRGVQALGQYLQTHPEDSGPIENWISWQMNTLNDRESRENFLLNNLGRLTAYPNLASKILTQLGILAMEKGDLDGPQGARAYFEKAFTAWPNNVDAADRLLRLGTPMVQSKDSAVSTEALQKQQIGINLKYQYYTLARWRARLQNNPYDLDAMYQLIDTLENLGYYKITADYYPFAYRLIDKFQPDSPLRAALRFRQVVNLYCRKEYSQALTLTQEILKNSPDDLLAIVAQAKILKKQNLDEASVKGFQRARELAAAAMVDPIASFNAEKAAGLAWYFCFIQPEPARAIELAQSALEKAPNEYFIRSLLAYAQTLNGAFEPAEDLLKNADVNNPAAVLAQAEILLKKQQDPKAAREKLKTLPAVRWGMLDDTVARFEAQLPPAEEAADQTPAGQQPPPLDEASNPYLAELKNNFPNGDLAMPEDPKKVVQCSMRLSSDVFHYDDPIEAKIYLSNIGTANLVFGPDNAVDPHLLILAEMIPAGRNQTTTPTSADSTASLLVMHRYVTEKPILQPGRSIILKEPLNIGPLRDILQNHPQNAYQVTFRLILDPVPDGKGGFAGKIPDIQPAPVVVVRQKTTPTASVMNFQFDTIAHAETDSKIKAVRLLAGLLREKQAGDTGKFDYPLVPIDAGRIWNAMGECLAGQDYRLRAWTSDALRNLTIPAELPIAGQLAQLLQDQNWFVVFMAINTLAPIADISDYLAWAQKQQQDPLMIRQIQWLQGVAWMPIELPTGKNSAAKK